MTELATALAVFISAEELAYKKSRFIVQVSEVVGDPPKHSYPCSIVVQSADQPSLLTTFPSSQTSPFSLLPSPQIGTQIPPLTFWFEDHCEVISKVAPCVGYPKLVVGIIAGIPVSFQVNWI
jgi:hypothetical protein